MGLCNISLPFSTNKSIRSVISKYEFFGIFEINSFLNNTIWRDYFYQKISDADPEIFNKRFIFNLLKSSGRYRNNGEKIAALVFFMCWVERYQPNFQSKA